MYPSLTKDLIRRAGNKLDLVVERGEMIVPSMSTAFPKAKSEDVVDDAKPKSYSQMVSYLSCLVWRCQCNV